MSYLGTRDEPLGVCAGVFQNMFVYIVTIFKAEQKGFSLQLDASLKALSENFSVHTNGTNDTARSFAGHFKVILRTEKLVSQL